MPEQPDPPITSCVLVGVTRNQRESVLATAAKFAELFAVPLVCAHVDQGRYETELHDDGTMESTPIDPDIVEDPVTAFDQQWRDQIHAVVPAGVDVVFRDLAGEIAHALSEEAEQLGAEVIVVGTRNGGIGVSVQEFFRGSPAVHLVHRQWRPVVVVPVSPTHPDHPLPWEVS
jgi:nucleotide-binding universal stress UspA family protein